MEYKNEKYVVEITIFIDKYNSIQNNWTFSILRDAINFVEQYYEENKDKKYQVYLYQLIESKNVIIDYTNV